MTFAKEINSEKIRTVLLVIVEKLLIVCCCC